MKAFKKAEGGTNVKAPPAATESQPAAPAKVEPKEGETPAAPATKPTRTNLEERSRKIREHDALVGIRQIHALEDLMGIEPNDPSPIPPETTLVEPTKLWVDAAYQRSISRSGMRLIMRIVANWNWAKFKPPVVAKDPEGRMNIVDGQHTAIGAASHPKIGKIPVMIVPIEELSEAAAAFLAHNTERVLVTAYDKYHARIVAEEANIVEIQEVLENCGIFVARIPPTSPDGAEVPNYTLATGELEKRHKKLGKAKFAQLMSVVAQCKFSPIRREHIGAIAMLIYPDTVTENEISPELLVQVVTSLNNADAEMNAARLAANLHITRMQGLAMHYRSQYRQIYPVRNRRRY